MNLNATILTAYKDILQKEYSDEAIRASIPVDIADGKYAEDGLLVVTEKHVIYFKDATHYTAYQITDAKEWKAEVMVGQGSLELKREDGDIEVCRFSMDQMPKHAAICKELNKILKGEEGDFSNSEPERRCPKCGRILPEGTRICIHCVNKRDTFLKLIKLVDKKYYFPLGICLLLMIVISGVSLVGPYLYRLLINEIFLPASANYGLFAFLIVAMFLVQFLSVALQIIRSRVMTKISNGISHDLRSKVFAKIESLPMAFLNTKKTGDLMHRVTQDTERIRQFVQNDLLNLISQMITLIAVLVLLFVMNWQMALYILLPVPLMVLAIRLVRGKIRGIYHIQWRLSAKADSVLQDIISGIRIVKAFGKEENEIARYRTVSRKFADRNILNERIWAVLTPILQFILNWGTYLIYLFGGQQILLGYSDLGELVQFTSYANNIYGPLRFMVHLPRIIANTAAAAGRIFEILDEDSSLTKAEIPVSAKALKGAVKIDKVSFGYKSYLDVLQEISLEVKPGEMIGLCGHSGSGKSTLINLILHFYEPESGEIYIDGVNIKDLDQNELRSQMGVVLQETYLFSGTIRDNIAFSKPDATEEEIIAAAKIANAHDFIVTFPDGYNTKIGERGQTLSGGEKQRIAIARAIIHDPKILILDEATSSLDTDTEFLIQEALGRLVKGRTTFAIAHRLSTLKNADRLLVLDHGKLVELGTHEELMEKEGVYYNLVMAQQKMSRLTEAIEIGK